MKSASTAPSLRPNVSRFSKLSDADDERSAAIYCWQGVGWEEEQAKETVAPLRTLHYLRTKVKDHIGGREAEEIRAKKHFEALCGDCDSAMERIAVAFGPFN